ncbi:5'/3'-nucleotidase SurE [Salinibaculum rarum]|uniref:5'/3'-nucleotidase SurE n=1 Tax=Salinibaculum rarum TaxID=3058903 RepID=UPI00265F9542|nr:5'/3'-nucleotidase SurE [Salinibaculum sp. KK48]
MADPAILLTNDDGIDAAGLVRLYEELTALGEVTVVAPSENQSGVGRARSHAVVRQDHPWGYTLSGTPADCVAYGLRGLDTDFDFVVSGCNHGPNAGNYVTGRSGTVGAGIEAAFLGTPAVAVSAYHHEDFFPDPASDYDFGRPARVTVDLCQRAADAGLFTAGTLLNVNVPLDVPDPEMRLTRPLPDYDLHVEHDADPDDIDAVDAIGRDGGLDADTEGTVVRMHEEVWPDVVGFENPFPPTEQHRERYPAGSDRRALVDGEISVSPLTIDRGDAETAALDKVIQQYNGARGSD